MHLCRCRVTGIMSFRILVSECVRMIEDQGTALASEMHTSTKHGDAVCNTLVQFASTKHGDAVCNTLVQFLVQFSNTKHGDAVCNTLVQFLVQFQDQKW